MCIRDRDRGDRLANHSIRVNVDTLDHLMTTVSELVLTRNQLLEIVRRNEDSDFKAVSYTHLDVYKRQGWKSSPAMPIA